MLKCHFKLSHVPTSPPGSLYTVPISSIVHARTDWPLSPSLRRIDRTPLGVSIPVQGSQPSLLPASPTGKEGRIEAVSRKGEAWWRNCFTCQSRLLSHFSWVFNKERPARGQKPKNVNVVQIQFLQTDGCTGDKHNNVQKIWQRAGSYRVIFFLTGTPPKSSKYNKINQG